MLFEIKFVLNDLKNNERIFGENVKLGKKNTAERAVLRKILCNYLNIKTINMPIINLNIFLICFKFSNIF